MRVSFEAEKVALPLLALLLLILFAAFFFLPNIIETAEGYPFTNKVILRADSKYQQIEVLELRDYGKALLLNGEFQIAEKDESFYHEALVLPAMYTALEDREPKVLIIGGGDGGAARQALKFKNANVTLVDLDEQVIKVANKTFGFSRDAFSNQRLRIIIGEGRSYLRDTDESYDVIILDLPDPDNTQVALLYTKEAFALAKKRLRKGGVVVAQSSSPFFYPKAYASIAKTSAAAFNRTYPYHAWVPMFGDWGYVLACDECDPLSASTLARISGETVSTAHYNGQVHVAYFMLSERMKKYLNDPEIRINEDDSVVLPHYSLVPSFE